jgi:hypothetical protein
LIARPLKFCGLVMDKIKTGKKVADSQKMGFTHLFLMGKIAIEGQLPFHLLAEFGGRGSEYGPNSGAG